MPANLLEEIRTVFLRPLSRLEEEEVLALHMYAAACLAAADLRIEKAARRK
jgi:hypothetical protein